MKQYQELLTRILSEGWARKDRTGTGTIGVFGHMMRFPMKDGFPLLTTKKLHLKSIIYELLWFLQGGTNIKYLNDHGVTIWDEWANKEGDLGPIYGAQWRNWARYIIEPNDVPDINGSSIISAFEQKHRRPNIRTEYVDQIANLIETLKTNPDNRRMLVSAWNVGDLPEMLFPPCHYGFQVSTRELTIDERLEWNKEHIPDYPTPEPLRAISLMWNQRSVDTFLGLPFNIASYAILLLMLAQVVDMIPDDLICSLGDTHLYKNHIEQAKLQLTRESRPLPKMLLNPEVKNIDDFKFEDFTLVDYNPHPHIKGDISI